MAIIAMTVGSVTVSKTVTAAQASRVLAAYSLIYGKVDDGAGGLRDMTNAEIATKIASGTIAGILANVHQREREVVQAAAVPPAEIIPT